MSNIPAITARLLIQFLQYSGFQQVRQKGSHIFFRHSDGRTGTVPMHKGEDLGKGIFNKILRDVEMSKEDFMAWYLK